mmetsp:Transcript_33400/g.79617  ORF Transcript_33400/g.79617 Transcript_33400/m.79617 type:complete len:225 (+) Transcript_33400:1038-1712(+)
MHSPSSNPVPVHFEGVVGRASLDLADELPHLLSAHRLLEAKSHILARFWVCPRHNRVPLSLEDIFFKDFAHEQFFVCRIFSEHSKPHRVVLGNHFTVDVACAAVIPLSVAPKHIDFDSPIRVGTVDLSSGARHFLRQGCFRIQVACGSNGSDSLPTRTGASDQCTHTDLFSSTLVFSPALAPWPLSFASAREREISMGSLHHHEGRGERLGCSRLGWRLFYNDR